MGKSTPTKPDAPAEEPATETALAPATPATSAMLALRSALAEIPTVDEDPTPKMMAAILAAPDASSWEDLFNAAHFKDYNGRKLRVHAFRQAESQYSGGLGVYFLLDATDLETGEDIVMTCGSDMAMAQLLNCWRRGDLPHDFEVVKKDRPTKAGFYPMRFRSLKKSTTGDPADVIEGESRAV